MRYIYLHGFASGPGSKKAQYFRGRMMESGLTLEVPQLDAGNFGELTISGQLAVVERLADGEPVSLMGSSMGGYLAALYAARHPEVRRLVLMAPAFCFARRWRSWLGDAQMNEWQRTGRRRVFHYGDNEEHELGYQLIEDAQRYEEFPAFVQPVLVFHGERDDVVPVEYSREFCTAHANARLHIMASDHELTDVMAEIAGLSIPFLLENE
jgi:pimeloyl-ACP methyl ester carboxylesterase